MQSSPGKGCKQPPVQGPATSLKTLISPTPQPSWVKMKCPVHPCSWLSFLSVLTRDFPCRYARMVLYLKTLHYAKQTVCHYLAATEYCGCSPVVFIRGVVRICNSHIINCFIKTAACGPYNLQQFEVHTSKHSPCLSHGGSPSPPPLKAGGSVSRRAVF